MSRGDTLAVVNPPHSPEAPRGATPAGRPQKTTARIVALLGAVLAAVLVMSFLISRDGISELQRARQRVADLQAEIDALEAENARLEAEIRSLQESTFAVERIARENLGMAREGEIVYMLPNESESGGTPEPSDEETPRSARPD